jgi:steroid 5-alpha reductase family enzyme
MIDTVWGLLLTGALVASLSMLALWLLQMRIHDASHVDAAWALLIAACGVLYALLADGSGAMRVLAALLAGLWGLRLGLYLLFDRVLGKDEDGRYQRLRRKWGTRVNRRFFWFFQLQAAAVCLFSLPFALMAHDGGDEIGLAVWLGVAVWLVGNAGAVVADRQLARWRSDPANNGKTMRGGLWSWSRHPNYFFESLTWCGVALAASTSPWGWVAWIVPAVLLFLLFRVTGIPATEAEALRSRPDYGEYRRTTSVFVPLPPRR